MSYRSISQSCIALTSCFFQTGGTVGTAPANDPKPTGSIRSASVACFAVRGGFVLRGVGARVAGVGGAVVVWSMGGSVTNVWCGVGLGVGASGAGGGGSAAVGSGVGDRVGAAVGWGVGLGVGTSGASVVCGASVVAVSPKKSCFSHGDTAGSAFDGCGVGASVCGGAVYVADGAGVGARVSASSAPNPACIQGDTAGPAVVPSAGSAVVGSRKSWLKTMSGCFGGATTSGAAVATGTAGACAPAPKSELGGGSLVGAGVGAGASPSASTCSHGDTAAAVGAMVVVVVGAASAGSGGSAPSGTGGLSGTCSVENREWSPTGTGGAAADTTAGGRGATAAPATTASSSTARSMTAHTTTPARPSPTKTTVTSAF